MAETLVVFNPLARRLAEAFWPGPLTLVLPRRPGGGLSDLVTAGLDTVGVRVPAHDLALALIRTADRPLAGPSANPSGRLSPTTAEQVTQGFAGQVPVLDGGPCRAGVESTILMVEGDTVTQLRAGALTRADIEILLGHPVMLAHTNAKITAPGMLASHYAPKASVRLNATSPEPGEAYLGFGPMPEVLHGPVRNLSAKGDLREAARNLFAMLHALDDEPVKAIAVAPIPETGLGEAINDRLARAAAPR